jgi:hypothetical protein
MKAPEQQTPKLEQKQHRCHRQRPRSQAECGRCDEQPENILRRMSEMRDNQTKNLKHAVKLYAHGINSLHNKVAECVAVAINRVKYNDRGLWKRNALNG